MWFSDSWSDYELLDCSDGQRLERWGKYILVRPDPQVLWKHCKKHPMWKRADAVYTRSGSGGGSWNENSLPEVFDPPDGIQAHRAFPGAGGQLGLVS